MPARLVFPTLLHEQLPAGLTFGWQANRFAVRSRDGTWFFAGQNGLNGEVWWFNQAGWQKIPLEPAPTMRPTLYADPTGLYVIGGFDGVKGERPPIWIIDEYRPYPAGGQDSRVPELAAQLETLAAELANLRGAIGQGGALDPSDRRALDWVRHILGSLLP